VSRFDAPIEANFTFVNVEEPAEPDEGDTWYNPDTDEAAVWDSNTWQQMNVTEHGALSGIGSNDHHTRPTETGSTSLPPVTDVGSNNINSGSLDNAHDSDPDTSVTLDPLGWMEFEPEMGDELRHVILNVDTYGGPWEIQPIGGGEALASGSNGGLFDLGEWVSGFRVYNTSDGSLMDIYEVNDLQANAETHMSVHMHKI